MLRYCGAVSLIMALLVTSCRSEPTPTNVPTQTPTTSPAPTQSVVSLLADLSLRAGPGADYSEIVPVSKDSPLNLLGVARGRDCKRWVLVRAPDGREGWLRLILIDGDIENYDIPSAPFPPPAALETPIPATCTGELALVQINNNFSGDLEAFVAGAESGFTLAIDGGASSFICVAPGQYCYDLTDGQNHETGGLFLPGGQCTCWHWGGARPQPGSCPCPEDPTQFQRP